MSSPLSPGHIVAGRYRVDTPIGEGGMGMVYLVRHVHTDEKLALKVLHAAALRDASAVERFRREARAPAQIASEHVARVTDADTAPDLGGAPFYVMEYLQGKDLERLIKEEGALPPATVVEYLRQVARALDKAHGMGIVHRDLKPENLFLTEREDGSPCIKLLDFGIARLAGGELPAHLKTQAGVMFGTPAFMSPEQMEGDLERIGPPTDIWSFGLIAFKLLCKEDFWTGTSVAVVCAQVLGIPMPTPTQRGSKLGPAFDDWFARCVSRDISARFKTAGEAVAALATALGVQLAAGRRSASMVDLPAASSLPGAVPPPTPSTPGSPAGSAAAPATGSAAGLPFDATVALGAEAQATAVAAAVRPDEPSPRPAVEGTISPTARTPSLQGESAEAGPGAGNERRPRVGLFLVATLLLVGGAVAAFFFVTGGRASPGDPVQGNPPEASSVATPPAADPLPGASVAPTDAPPVAASASAAPATSASAAPSGGSPGVASGGPRPSGWPAGTRPPEPPPDQTAQAPPAPPTPPTPPTPPPTTTPPPAASSKPSTGGGRPSSSEQRARLASLQRLCDQGIYTPSECAAKRQAILQGSP